MHHLSLPWCEGTGRIRAADGRVRTAAGGERAREEGSVDHARPIVSAQERPGVFVCPISKSEGVNLSCDRSVRRPQGLSTRSRASRRPTGSSMTSASPGPTSTLTCTSNCSNGKLATQPCGACSREIAARRPGEPVGESQGPGSAMLTPFKGGAARSRSARGSAIFVSRQWIRTGKNAPGRAARRMYARSSGPVITAAAAREAWMGNCARSRRRKRFGSTDRAAFADHFSIARSDACWRSLGTTIHSSSASRDSMLTNLIPFRSCWRC